MRGLPSAWAYRAPQEENGGTPDVGKSITQQKKTVPIESEKRRPARPARSPPLGSPPRCGHQSATRRAVEPPHQCNLRCVQVTQRRPTTAVKTVQSSATPSRILCGPQPTWQTSWSGPARHAHPQAPQGCPEASARARSHDPCRAPRRAARSARPAGEGGQGRGGGTARLSGPLPRLRGGATTHALCPPPHAHCHAPAPTRRHTA